MKAERGDRAERLRAARRYAAWVRGELEEREWDQAMLVRRSGLAKQTVSTIVNGQSQQPTAHQVASLAHAFRMDPAHVLAALGLWEPTTAQPVSPALSTLYTDLNQPERRALLRMGEALRELQGEYETIQNEPRAALGEPEPPEP